MKNLTRGALLVAATLTLAAAPFAGASTSPGGAESHATKPKACPKGKIAKIVKGKRVCALKPCPAGKARKKVVAKGVASWICASRASGGGGTTTTPAKVVAPKGYDGTLTMNRVTTASGGSRTDATTVSWKWVQKPGLLGSALGSYVLQSADVKVVVTGGFNSCTLSGGAAKSYPLGAANVTDAAPPDFGYTDFSKTGSSFSAYDRAKPVYWYLQFSDTILDKTLTNTCPNTASTEAYGEVSILLGTSTPELFPAQALNSATESPLQGTTTTTSTSGQVTVVTSYTWSWTAIR